MKTALLSILIAWLSHSLAFSAPVVVTKPATEIGDISARLTGTINVNSVGYWLVEFQIGKTEALELSSVPPVETYFVQGSTAGNETQTLNSPKLTLHPGTTYYYRFSARNTNNLSEYHQGGILSFTTVSEEEGGTLPTAIPLDFSTLPISHKDARLSAQIFSGSSPTKVFLRYGTGYPLQNQASIAALQPTNTTQDHSIRIAGLKPSTLYHYQWLVTNSRGSSFSEPRSLTTAAAPSLLTRAASEIRPDSALLNGTVTLNGGRHASVTFEYGETPAYGRSAIPSTSHQGDSTDYSVLVSGLRANTTYHYRIRTSQNGGGAIEYGENRTFTTKEAGEAPSFNAEPVVDDLNISSASIVMPELFSGTSLATLVVEYGTDTGFGLSKEHEIKVPAFTTYTDRATLLTDLEPGTLYHFRIRLTNQTGSVLTAASTFHTHRAPLVTTGQPVDISDIHNELTGTFDLAGGSIRPGLQWGETTGYEGHSGIYYEISGTGETTHVFSINTKPNTTYHYRVYAFDGVRYYYGEDRSFTTAAPTTPPDFSDPRVATSLVGSNPLVRRPHISGDQARLEAFFFTGGSPATLEFEYGTTAGLGQSQIAGFPNQTDLFYVLTGTDLTNLTPDTKYYWRARASNASGTKLSPILTFTTLKAPVVTTRPAISVTDSSATLVGGITPDKWEYKLEIVFGLDESMPLLADQITPSWVDGLLTGVPDLSNRNVTASVSGLLPNTTYRYQLRAKSNDNISPHIYKGEILTFTTSPPATPPAIGGALLASGQTETTVKLTLESFHAGSSTSTVTFEYGTTTGYGQSVVLPDTFPTGSAGSPELVLTGLTPGTTYHARVKITNGQGTVHSPDLSFSTLPPGAAPVFSGNTGTQFITISGARLLAGQLIPGDAQTTLLYEYGTTAQYGTSVSQIVSAGSSPTSPWVNISGLQPETEYHFRVTASSVYGTAVTADNTFTTALAPVVVTHPATAVTDISAVINGEVAPNGIANHVRFQWGATPAYGNQINPPGAYISGSETVPFSVSLEGLKPNTTYHYRIGFGSFYGADATFTTGSPASPPVVSPDLSIQMITSTGATVRLPEAKAGGSEALISFEYGTTTSYGQETAVQQTIAAGEKVLNATAELAGLAPDTVYHVRSKVTNLHGTVYGEDHIFSTSFRVVTGIVSDISQFKATLNGAVNPGGGLLRLSFRWGDSTSLSQSIAATTPTASGIETVSVTSLTLNLQPSTTYYYRLQGVDSGNKLVAGDTLSFTTPASTAQPSIYNPSMSISSITKNSASLTFSYIHPGTAQTTVTFDYGTTTAYGDSAYAGLPIAPGSPPKLFLSNLTGLLPDTLYYVRARAVNEHGTALSENFSFRTLPAPVFTALQPTEIKDLTVTLNGRVEFNGNGGISPRFMYGKTGINPQYYNSTTAYLVSTDPETGAKTYSTALTHFTPDTEYSFQIGSGYGTSEIRSEVFTFRTLPGATRPSFITDTFTALVSHDRARVNFGNVFAGSSNTTIAIEYGTTTAYGSQVSVNGVTTNNSTDSVAILAGLSPGTTYHVRAKAENAQGVTYSQLRTIKTYQVPVFSLNAAQNVSDISALLTGSVNPGDRELTVYFRLVPNSVNSSAHTVTSGSITVQGGTSSAVTFEALRRLLPGLTYHCKLFASDGLNEYNSNEIQFTTGSPASPPEIYASALVSKIADTSASVRLTAPTGRHLHPGSSQAKLFYDYGLSENFGESVQPLFWHTFDPPSTGSNSYDMKLSDLTPSSTYYLRPRVTNSEGTAYGETVTFNTLPVLTPKTLNADEISDVSAMLHGSVEKTADPVETIFQYGLTESYGSTISAGTTDSPEDRRMLKTNLRFLTPEITYHYRLRVRYSGSTDYYYGENRTFTTLPPVPAVPQILNNLSTTAIGTSSITLRSYCDTGSAATDLILDYGTTGSLENTVPFATSVAPNTKSFLSKIIEGLLPGTRYFFRLTATNAVGTTVGDVVSFTTLEIPVPFGVTAHSISSVSAILVGAIQSQAGIPGGSFEWGLDTSYGTTTTAFRSSGSYTATISGLLPGRTYHYRFVIGSGPSAVYSEDMTFTTLPVPGPPFVGEILTSYGVTAAAATVWIDRVAAPADIVFEYGTTSAFGQSAAFPAIAVNSAFHTDVAVDLDNLLPDTLYHFRCVATNNQGTTESPTFTFRTLPAPVLLSTPATDVFGGSATLRAEINPNQNLLFPSFEYGLTPDFESPMEIKKPLLTGIHASGISAGVSQLLPGTTYYYRITAMDPRGRRYHGSSGTVTTLSKIEDWRRTKFGYHENTGIAADHATPYGDNTPNLIKYALGIEPRDNMPDLMTKRQTDGRKYPGMSFVRDPDKTDLIYTVEKNYSLSGSWEAIATSSRGAPTTGSGVISESPSEGSEMTVVVSDTAELGSNPKIFFRLKITRSE